MRALLEDMKSGKVAAYDVPAPELQRGRHSGAHGFFCDQLGHGEGSGGGWPKIPARESDGSP